MLYVWSWMQTLGASLRHRDEGATMVEYGLLIAIIAVVVAAAAVLLAGAITGWFDEATNAPA